jgi:hypothetical protein
VPFDTLVRCRLINSDVFERTKHKYIEHIKNVQRDLHETRQLIERDAEFKANQECAHQKLIDERLELLTRYKSNVSNVNTCSRVHCSTVATDAARHPPACLISHVTVHRQVSLLSFMSIVCTCALTVSSLSLVDLRYRSVHVDKTERCDKILVSNDKYLFVRFVVLHDDRFDAYDSSTMCMSIC